MRALLMTTTALTAVATAVVPALAADNFPTIEQTLAAAHESPVYDPPAVSGVNGKLYGFATDVQTGNYDEFDEDFEASLLAYGVGGALSVPLGHDFGAQFDGVFGSAEDEMFYGGAAHIFWRDPSKGLIGLYASYLVWDGEEIFDADYGDYVIGVYGADVGRIGAEAELYHDQVSLEGRLTYQFGDIEGIAGNATLAYYVHDNLRFDIGYDYLEGRGSLGTVGMEWAPFDHMSVFADAAFGENEYMRTSVGLSIYLSGDNEKSLIRRHREDDPTPNVQEDLFLLVGDAGCPEGQYEPYNDGYCEPIDPP